ncbi:hypothetical protein [Algibacter luteus]|uniref:hypothetical protein n=1 Tax=Algibacter luteus TaxID=1178825 RepID=UPI00259979C3|nr:hypothetical protein [Algibacter luteus]WJJ96352.1 hypothetical protein O5O44_14150 [Algibacter luteus]
MEEKTWSEIKELLESYISNKAEFNFQIDEIRIKKIKNPSDSESGIKEVEADNSPKYCYIDPWTGEMKC